MPIDGIPFYLENYTLVVDDKQLKRKLQEQQS